MRILFSVIILGLSLQAHAEATMAFQGGLGFSEGAIHLAADVDWQKKRSHSFGAFFVLGTEKERVRGQFWALGGDVKVFFGPDNWKVYLAPGLGVISFDSAPPGTTQSETTFGSLFKVGTLLEVAHDMYAGMEFMYLQNWFSDKIFGGSYFLTSASFRINF